VMTSPDFRYIPEPDRSPKRIFGRNLLRRRHWVKLRQGSGRAIAASEPLVAIE
jgi:hypothetical protein